MLLDFFRMMKINRIGIHLFSNGDLLPCGPHSFRAVGRTASGHTPAGTSDAVIGRETLAKAQADRRIWIRRPVSRPGENFYTPPVVVKMQ
jgi:hypothetical protein